MGVLNEYGVSADDSDKIKELISVADMKRDEVGLWCVYKEGIKKYFIWLTVPVISVCVSKYLDIDNETEESDDSEEEKKKLALFKKKKKNHIKNKYDFLI